MRFLVVSGPTREPIDPVRYISNYSTGSLGNYLAEAVKARGHKLDWVRCPEDVESARDLLKKLRSRLPKNDVLIMAAAVCDSRPVTVSSQKIKKDKLSTIHLVKNPDILAELSKSKKKGQIFIGFALESTRILESGYQKLVQKGLELIVVQEVKKNKTPFGDKPIDVFLVDRCCAQPLKAVRKKKLAFLLVAWAEGLAAS